MQTLLIPVNSSKTNKSAIKYAIEFAKLKPTKIILLHAYHTVPYNWDSSDQELKQESIALKEKSIKKLNKLAKRITRKCDAICENISYEGFPADAIIAHTFLLKPDLILIETEILNAINYLVFGPVTEKVIRKINGNILIIPENAPKKPLQRIAFATIPYNDDSFELNYLINLTEGLQSQIHIVHFLPSETTDRELGYDLKKHELDINFAHPNHEFSFHSITDETPLESLGKYVVENHIDTVVVTKRESETIQKLFGYHIAKKPTYHTNIPILITKNIEAE